jgi:Putative adhesin
MTISRRLRHTWIGAGSFVAVVSLGWGAYQATSLLSFDSQKFRESFTAAETAAVETIDVDNDCGSVEIIGSDRDDVVIDGRVIRGLTAPTHSERVAGSTLELDARCNPIAEFGSVDYDIQVPRDVAVKVRASEAGVRVSNVSGALDVSSSGGGVRVEGAHGALRLRSSGGGVTGFALESRTADASSSDGGVRLEFLDEPQTVTASSSGGGVTVVIPDTNVSYNVDASSSGGGVSRDVRSDPTSDRTITVHSSDGGVTVRYPEAP